MHIRYQISCMYGLMRIYRLTRIRYHIFRIYMISHVLVTSHILTDFRSSDLPCDVSQYGYNAIYLSLYSLYDLYGLYDLHVLHSLELIYS